MFRSKNLKFRVKENVIQMNDNFFWLPWLHESLSTWLLLFYDMIPKNKNTQRIGIYNILRIRQIKVLYYGLDSHCLVLHTFFLTIKYSSEKIKSPWFFFFFFKALVTRCKSHYWLGSYIVLPFKYQPLAWGTEGAQVASSCPRVSLLPYYS